MGYVIGVDGGGTRTTLLLADSSGREILRREGPPGLVDPRSPAASAESVAALIRSATGDAELTGRADALCAGLAGVGNAAEREIVQRTLEGRGLAARVLVVSDGEIALEGALGSDPGILLVSGTGSIAYGRGERGQVLRCGGWGMMLGDEGSGYAIGRAALRAALCSVDGRGPKTRLLEAVGAETGVAGPDALPPWVGRAGKADVARLTAGVIELAKSEDEVAFRILQSAAGDLASHAFALRERLAPWSGASAVVLHGGVTRHPLFVDLVAEALSGAPADFNLRPSESDAVTGAVRLANASTLLRSEPEEKESEWNAG